MPMSELQELVEELQEDQMTNKRKFKVTVDKLEQELATLRKVYGRQ